MYQNSLWFHSVLTLYNKRNSALYHTLFLPILTLRPDTTQPLGCLVSTPTSHVEQHSSPFFRSTRLVVSFIHRDRGVHPKTQSLVYYSHPYLLLTPLTVLVPFPYLGPSDSSNTSSHKFHVRSWSDVPFPNPNLRVISLKCTGSTSSSVVCPDYNSDRTTGKGITTWSRQV